MKQLYLGCPPYESIASVTLMGIIKHIIIFLQA